MAFAFYRQAIMYLLEPKGGGGRRSVGLFYCLILSAFTWSSWQSWEKAEICLAILIMRLMPRFVRFITLNKKIKLLFVEVVPYTVKKRSASSDIPAGDGKLVSLFLRCKGTSERVPSRIRPSGSRRHSDVPIVFDNSVYRTLVYSFTDNLSC